MQDHTFIVTAPDGTQYEVTAPEGTSEDEVLNHVQASENAKLPRLSPDDEKRYSALSADPKSTAADITGFLKDRGFSADDRVVNDFIRRRGQKGVRVADQVLYQLPKAPPRPTQGRPNTALETISATAQEALNGAVPNAGRFLAGAGGAVGNAIAAPFSENVDFDPAGAFQEEQDASDQNRRRLEEDHPNVANGAWSTGLAGSLLLPQARVFRGGGLGAGVGNGAITGLGYGTLSGALNDTGDGRVANAAAGGTAGLAIGAAAPAAFRGIGSAAQSARANIPGADATARFLSSIPGRAAGRQAPHPDAAAHAQGERILADMLPRSGINTGMGTTGVQANPVNIADEVANRTAIGVPAMPADVSEQGRRVTSWALGGNGPMAQRARAVLSQRQAQSAQRIRGHVAQELGAPVDPIVEAENIVQRAQTAATEDYRRAYAQGNPMVLTDELAGLMRRPAFQEALPQAYRNIQNRGGNPEALGFRLVPHGDGRQLPPNMPHAVTPEGVYILSQQPTFEAFDQVVRTLDKSIKRNPLTGRPELDNESGAINDVKTALDGYLRRTNDAFASAKTNYADEMAIRDAMNRGQQVSRFSGPEIEQQLRTMPQHAQEAWMAGARTSLADDAIQAGLKPTANVAQRVRQGLGLSGAGGHAAVGDEAKLRAIETMSGRPGVMNRIDDRLEAEDQAFKTFNESFGSSKTQPRQAMDDAMSGEALQTAKHLLYGNWAGAIGGVLFKGNPQGTLRFKQAVQDRIAEIMTTTGARDVREAMDAIVERVRHDDEFRSLLNRAGITPAKLIALQVAGQDARAAPLDSDPDPEAQAEVEDPYPAYSYNQP